MPIYHLAPIQLSPVERTEQFPSLSTTNDSDPNITYFRGSNLWIGMSPLNLIRLGAKFSPCMRRDFGIRRTVLARIVAMTSEDSGYGCCQNQDRVGNSLLAGCIGLPGGNGSSEFFFLPGTRCNASTNAANFHPCCISLTGRCEIMEADQCEARGGFYHPDEDSCDRVRGLALGCKVVFTSYYSHCR